LLAVVVGERDALVGNAVDVGRLIAHHPAAEIAQVPGADVIPPEDQDVRFLAGHDALLRRATVDGGVQRCVQRVDAPGRRGRLRDRMTTAVPSGPAFSETTGAGSGRPG